MTTIEDNSKVSKLLIELKDIKKEWLENLNKVKQQKNEYTELINEVREIRDSLKNIKE